MRPPESNTKRVESSKAFRLNALAMIVAFLIGLGVLGYEWQRRMEAGDLTLQDLDDIATAFPTELTLGRVELGNIVVEQNLQAYLDSFGFSRFSVGSTLHVAADSYYLPAATDMFDNPVPPSIGIQVFLTDDEGNEYRIELRVQERNGEVWIVHAMKGTSSSTSLADTYVWTDLALVARYVTVNAAQSSSDPAAQALANVINTSLAVAGDNVWLPIREALPTGLPS